MVITKQFYNDQQHTDTNSLIRALLVEPDKISSAITWLAGKESDRFPLSFLTEGAKNVEYINGHEYEYNVGTKTRRARPLVRYSGNGVNGDLFKLVFPEKWFVNQYVLVSPSGAQARIMSEPVAVSDGYEYTMQIVNPVTFPAIPASDLVAGSKYAQLFAPVAYDYSRGNASNWSAPSKLRHRITTFRKSYGFSGGSVGYVAVFNMPTKSGGTSPYWMDWEEYEYMMQWKQECENLWWYATQSYNDKGETMLKDENGRPINIAPGLLQQIQNKSSFSTMSEEIIRTTIGDMFYGMSDGQNRNVTLFTGEGGIQDFDDAMKTFLASQSWLRVNEPKFISGEGRELSIGGYFNQYKSIQGHTVTVTKMPLFDYGAVAEAADKHPRTGYPLESHRMVFVDTTRYDGQANLVGIQRKARSMVRWAVAGSVVPSGYGNDSNLLRASDIDGANVHFLKEGGILLRRFDTSIDLRCIAS